MPFPFTFKLLPPGLSNPFSPIAIAAQPDSQADGSIELEVKRRRPSPGPSPSIAAPISRKRVWQPSFAEPSQSTTTIASTSGYLDTPSKYRDMTGSPVIIEHEFEDVHSELPPAKRRRTLAGSIVSTALSAALIGTAVGLTVYRLWRNRGKEPEQAPPPPYQQVEWTPVPQQPQGVQVAPATPRNRKPRHLHSHGSAKRAVVHHRKQRPRGHPYTPPQTFSPTRPEFDFTRRSEEIPDVEDQMDWIGDKLSMLIEQGKKALGTEVVVMSDAKEDEVDDGTGAWEEETTPAPLNSSQLSRQHSKSFSFLPPSYPHSLSSHTPSSSPSAWSTRFDTSAGLPISPPRTTRGMSVDSDTRSISGLREDQNAWDSPELRESMEKARARFLRNRGS